jgi:hypothetical protein
MTGVHRYLDLASKFSHQAVPQPPGLFVALVKFTHSVRFPMSI